MEQFTLEIESRSKKGSTGSRQTRRDGFLPIVVYGNGQESVSAQVVYNTFVKLAEQIRSTQIVTLKSADKRIDGKSALVRQIQKDYVRGKVLHVDIQTFKDDDLVTVRVPLHFVGEPVGVKIESGVLTVFVHDILVSCKARVIPQFIDVDISALGLGKRLHASDIVLIEGVVLKGNPEETVASVTTKKEEEAAAPTAAAAAGAAATAEGAVAPEAGATTAAAGGDAAKKAGADAAKKPEAGKKPEGGKK